MKESGLNIRFREVAFRVGENLANFLLMPQVL
jgi:hypothetical protein